MATHKHLTTTTQLTRDWIESELFTLCDDLMEMVGHDMDALRDAAEALLALGEKLLETQVNGTPEPGPMAEIWALYSMEEERAVHRKLFGSDGLEAAAPAEHKPSSSGDDIDDILF